MKVFFNISKEKSSRLVDALCSNIDARKKYQLSIFTCYLADDLAKVKDFIEEVSNNIKLTDVRLYIDARECIRIGLNHLQDFQKSYFDHYISLDIIAIDTPTLFHSKAYTLLSHDEKSGLLLMGSANFSKGGLFANRGGNYESLLMTNDIETVNQFLSLEGVQDKYIKTLDRLEEYKAANFTFKYALLQQGRFVHKWSETFNQYFAIKYKLSEKAKNEIGNDVLRSLGFAVDAETISRQFFDFSNLKKDEEADEKQFNRLLRRGIETYLGHWLPSPLLHEIGAKIQTNKIFETLSENIDQQLIEHQQRIIDTFERLKVEGFIDKSDESKDPIQEVRDKLAKLEQDHDKLYRLWHKFYDFELPYDLSQKDDIEIVYKDLVNRIQSKKRKNAAAYSVLESLDTLRPNAVFEYFMSHELDTIGDEDE